MQGYFISVLCISATCGQFWKYNIFRVLWSAIAPSMGYQYQYDQKLIGSLSQAYFNDGVRLSEELGGSNITGTTPRSTHSPTAVTKWRLSLLTKACNNTILACFGL